MGNDSSGGLRLRAYAMGAIVQKTLRAGQADYKNQRPRRRVDGQSCAG